MLKNAVLNLEPHAALIAREPVGLIGVIRSAAVLINASKIAKNSVTKKTLSASARVCENFVTAISAKTN